MRNKFYNLNREVLLEANKMNMYNKNKAISIHSVSISIDAAMIFLRHINLSPSMKISLMDVKKSFILKEFSF